MIEGKPKVIRITKEDRERWLAELSPEEREKWEKNREKYMRSAYRIKRKVVRKEEGEQLSFSF